MIDYRGIIKIPTNNLIKLIKKNIEMRTNELFETVQSETT